MRPGDRGKSRLSSARLIFPTLGRDFITSDLWAVITGHLGLQGGEGYTGIRGEMSEGSFQPLEGGPLSVRDTWGSPLEYAWLTSGIELPVWT